jgi:hypothetical protein
LSSLLLVATATATLANTEPQVQPVGDVQIIQIPLWSGRAERGGVAAFLRTELYFGSNKPDGTAVTPEEFQAFVDAYITPRFPDGLTLLTGVGQFRGANGVTERERSVLLILLYPVQAAKKSGQRIEEIRSFYEHKFQQESVLRADQPLFECVSF